jgi:predicted metal-binding protein
MKTDRIADRDGAGAYETYSGIVNVAEIEHGSGFKELCRPCPTYGRNLACPPHSPSFEEFAGSAVAARVICVRLPQPDAGCKAADRKTEEAFREAGDILKGMLLEYRAAGRRIAGAGPCRSCAQCAGENGQDACRRTDDRIYSLESLGVNVVALSRRACGIDIEWASGSRKTAFIAAVGAVFFEKGDLPSDDVRRPTHTGERDQ